MRTGLLILAFEENTLSLGLLQVRVELLDGQSQQVDLLLLRLDDRPACNELSIQRGDQRLVLGTDLLQLVELLVELRDETLLRLVGLGCVLQLQGQ